MRLLRLWKKTSRGRRLNIKRIFLFPVIFYEAYILIDSFIPLFMIVCVFGYCIAGKARIDIKI